MKKILKSMIATILCAVIAVTSFGTEAYAASKTPIKITFKSKTVTLYANNNGLTSAKFSTMKKKWGKPKTEKDEYSTNYVWTKGKTTIRYSDIFTNPEHSHVWIDIEDKNASLCGLKVGMKKSAALKIMKKYGGEDGGYGSMSAEIKSNRVQMICYYKNNKVTSIYITAYLAP